MTAKRKVFLAHASEDKGQVRDLYSKLVNRGFKPWLDEIDLLPGQNWQIGIPKAIRESDIFIACLSRLSVKKQGYVQREFRSALSTYAEKPPGSIYLIPLKLDDCEIPDFQLPQLGISLRDIQWLDYWRPDGFERLVSSIEAATGHTGAQRTFAPSGASTRPQGEAGRSKAIADSPGSGRLVRQVAAGVLGAFGAVMVFMSVVDAGVSGISEGGVLIGAICLGLAYGLWPRGQTARQR